MDDGFFTCGCGGTAGLFPAAAATYPAWLTVVVMDAGLGQIRTWAKDFLYAPFVGGAADIIMAIVRPSAKKQPGRDRSVRRSAGSKERTRSASQEDKVEFAKPTPEMGNCIIHETKWPQNRAGRRSRSRTS